MNLKVTDLLSVGGFVLGSVALVLGIVDHKKTKELANKVGVSVERLRDMTEVEVSDSLIKNTVNDKVNKVVTEKVTEASRRAVDAVQSDMHRTIKAEVDDAVRDRSEAIREGVEKRIDEQVQAGIDINEMSRRVEKNAERAVMEQMKGVVAGVQKLASDELSSKLSAYNEVGKIVKGVLSK